MEPIWMFNSVSDDENIKNIYCVVIKSTPIQYIWKIEMKSGQQFSLHRSKSFLHLFTEKDIIAIYLANNKAEELYEQQKIKDLRDNLILIERERHIQELLEKQSPTLNKQKNNKCFIL
jgi:hypothetical protein